jgi:hypothetical protein
MEVCLHQIILEGVRTNNVFCVLAEMEVFHNMNFRTRKCYINLNYQKFMKMKIFAIKCRTVYENKLYSNSS